MEYIQNITNFIKLVNKNNIFYENSADGFDGIFTFSTKDNDFINIRNIKYENSFNNSTPGKLIKIAVIMLLRNTY